MNNDMSKCGNENCTLKLNCKRYTYKSTSPMQSYNYFIPHIREGKEICLHQIEEK